MRRIAVLAVALLAGACQANLPGEPPTRPQTQTAIVWKPAPDAVVEAFADHAVVAIGEIHGSRSIHAFLRETVEDPRLAGVLNDVAVEFGSARHQDTIDRYIAGEGVPDADLELVWTDTTQRSGVWNSPVYREFFDHIRSLNAGRPAEHHLRVILGDPPIDWESITSTGGCDDVDPGCLDHWLFQRDEHFAGVVGDESLARGRRVLLIAGAGHIRRNVGAGGPRSLTDELDATHPGATWVMLPVDAATLRRLAVGAGAMGAVDWESPGVAAAIPIADTVLADQPPEAVFDRGTVTCDHPPCEGPSGPIARLGDVADALLVP